MSARLTVVTGPMFSGKTETLLWYARRAQIAELPIQTFVPAMDTRHGEGIVRSHAGHDLQGYGVGVWTVSPETIHVLASRLRFDSMLVLIDEAQFMPEGIVEQVQKMLTKSRHVVVAGLSQDFAQRPFGFMPQLLALADDVQKLTAICSDCKADNATLTRRLTASKDQVQLGGMKQYAPVCRRCFTSRSAE